jgi:hypothetical protein
MRQSNKRAASFKESTQNNKDKPGFSLVIQPSSHPHSPLLHRMFLPCRGCSLTAVSSLNPENKSKINSARSEPPFLKPAQIKIPKINLKKKG